MFVLQVTGIDWQPGRILTRGPDSLRGAMPGRPAIRWWGGGGVGSSYAPSSSCTPLICFSNEAGRRSAACRAGGREAPRPVIDEASAALARLSRDGQFILIMPRLLISPLCAVRHAGPVPWHQPIMTAWIRPWPGH